MPNIKVNGAELHYKDRGSGSPAVVFIPGVWMSARYFDKQLAYFTRHHRTVVFDLRAHGRSEQVHTGHTVMQYARDLRAVLEALDLKSVVAVGHSMGAMVIWEYVKQFGTDRLKGAVFVDQSPSDYRSTDYPYGLDFAGLCRVMYALQTDHPGFVERFVRMMFKTPPSKKELAWMVEETLRVPASIAASIFFDRTIQDYRAVLPSITVPSLVCRGAHDRWVAQEAAELTVSRLPTANLELFAESAHCPFYEEADRFNQVVGVFLATIANE